MRRVWQGVGGGQAQAGPWRRGRGPRSVEGSGALSFPPTGRFPQKKLPFTSADPPCRRSAPSHAPFREKTFKTNPPITPAPVVQAQVPRGDAGMGPVVTFDEQPSSDAAARRALPPHWRKRVAIGPERHPPRAGKAGALRARDGGCSELGAKYWFLGETRFAFPAPSTARFCSSTGDTKVARRESCPPIPRRTGTGVGARRWKRGCEKCSDLGEGPWAILLQNGPSGATISPFLEYLKASS